MTQDEKNVLIKSQRINRWSAQKLYYNKYRKEKTKKMDGKTWRSIFCGFRREYRK